MRREGRGHNKGRSRGGSAPAAVVVRAIIVLEEGDNALAEDLSLTHCVHRALCVAVRVKVDADEPEAGQALAASARLELATQLCLADFVRQFQ